MSSPVLPNVKATVVNAKPAVEQMKTVQTKDVVLRNMTDEEMLADASIIASPLAMPEQLDIKPKRPEYQFRWVQRRANDGSWYERMKAAGFMNATTDDVEGLSTATVVKDGFITCGDLILMKIEKVRYAGFIKHNYEKAQRLVNRKEIHDSAKSHAESTFRTGAGNNPNARKVQFFTPSAAEAEAKVSGDK